MSQLVITLFLFKMTNAVQWSRWLLIHVEDSYLISLGGLHINMALLTCVGDLLDGICRISHISHDQVASHGTVYSFLKVSHVKKTARAHQVTSCAL